MADPAAQIAAINARIARMYPSGHDTTRSTQSSHANRAPPRTQSVLSSTVQNNVSDFGGSKGSKDDVGEDVTVKSDTSLSAGSVSSTTVVGTTSSTATHKIKTGGRVLCPSDVAEDLDVEFLDHKRRHRFPPCGITVKSTSTSTYNGVKFIECTFDAYEGTTLDDCVLDDVLFIKCHFRGTQIIKLIAKGVRFTGCIFGQTHFENITLVEDAVLLNQSFAFDRVIRGPTSDNSPSARISAINEFEVVKNGKNVQPRQQGWAHDKNNRAVQGAGQLVEAPAFAGWENKVVKPAAPGDLMSFEQPIDFEEAEAQAHGRELVEMNGVIRPKNPNWNRQFIRQGTNAVKLVDHEVEEAAHAKTFAPTNFVTVDFDADPETRKEEVTDKFEIGKREYYGTSKNKAKRFWSEKKAEQQQYRRRNIPGAPHYY